MSRRSAQKPELLGVEPGIPPGSCLPCVGAHENPLLLVTKEVGAFETFFVLAADDARVELDLSVRIEGSPAGAARAILELDVLLGCELGPSHTNLPTG